MTREGLISTGVATALFRPFFSDTSRGPGPGGSRRKCFHNLRACMVYKPPMTFHELPIPGLFLIKPTSFTDTRGSFVKPYHRELFLEQGIDFVPKEQFYSISQAGVLRGMHFQVPPAHYGKLVYCVRGRIQDVVLDLRAGSPAYGQSWSGFLDDKHQEALYLSAGLAHGFYSLDNETTVFYLVSQLHHHGLDQGIRWDSFGHVWPGTNPILSQRDRDFPAWSDFSTPFAYS